MSKDISIEFLDGFFYNGEGHAGALDIDFLHSTMRENDIKFDAILDSVNEIGYKNSKDINVYIYALFYLIEWELKEKILAVGLEHIEHFDPDIVADYEVNIYTNFLDSGFDDAYFNNLSLEDIDKEWVTTFYNAIL